MLLTSAVKPATLIIAAWAPGVVPSAWRRASISQGGKMSKGTSMKKETKKPKKKK
jgi:hypothetical protein